MNLPSPPALSVAECRRFNDHVAELYASALREEPLPVIARTLATVVGGTVAAACLSPALPEKAPGFALSEHGAFDWSPEQFLLLQSHPRLQSGPRGEVLSVSDFLSQARWQRTDLYNVDRGSVRLEDDLGVDLRLPGGELFQGCVIREERNFTERDRLLFTLLLPHLRNLLMLNPPSSASCAPAPDRLVGLGLTPREQEVLYWISEGKTNADTATILNISPGTVRVHLERIYPKLGVENRMSASRIALEKLYPARFGA